MSAPNGRGSVIGNFSFEGDSLPEFSELEDTPSEILHYRTERYCMIHIFLKRLVSKRSKSPWIVSGLVVLNK